MLTKAKIALFMLGVPEKEISKRLGCSPAYISRCLAGKQKPSKRLIQEVARVTKLEETEEIFR